jgi:hypothetical protein
MIIRSRLKRLNLYIPSEFGPKPGVVSSPTDVLLYDATHGA